MIGSVKKTIVVQYQMKDTEMCFRWFSVTCPPHLMPPSPHIEADIFCVLEHIVIVVVNTVECFATYCYKIQNYNKCCKTCYMFGQFI